MTRSRTLVQLLATAALSLGALGCGSSDSSDLNPNIVPFGQVIPLAADEVQAIVRGAAEAVNSPDLHVGVVDRTGNILAVYSSVGPNPAAQDEDNIAVSLARTTAFFSNSQAPLSSRTVQYLSTFHFPPTFAAPFRDPLAPPGGGAGPMFPNTAIAPQQTTAGVRGTPQGPLWQINATNRGAFIAALDPAAPTSTPPTGLPTEFTNPPTTFVLGNEWYPSRNVDGTFPSPGITLLPGAVPLYKPDSLGTPRCVGGVGVFVRAAGNMAPDLEAAEFAAVQGARSAGFFLDIEPTGRIFLLGLLLPYVEQTTRPQGYGPGVFDPNGFVPFRRTFSEAPSTVALDGRADPFGFLIAARDSVNPPPANGGLAQQEVAQIVQQCVDTANRTRAAIRLPLGSTAVIIATVTDLRGAILAHFRMEDSLTDAVDVVPAKARSTVYYSLPSGASPLTPLVRDQADEWPGFPVDPTGQNRGVAITTRTLGFLSQPFYPPSIEGTDEGPLFGDAVRMGNLPVAGALFNQLPTQATRLGNAAPDPGYQNGLTYFPGSVPLYKNGVLVGALGVSGDGVEQNDFIAAGGAVGFEPPPELRCDNFSFEGIRLPYLKFPPNPTLNN